MKYRTFVAAVFGVALLAGLTACAPEPPPTSTVVSSFTDTSGTGFQAYNKLAISQAFVMPSNGWVTRVSLAIGIVSFAPSPSPLPVTVQIQGTDSSGFPNGTVLASGVWNGPLPPTTSTLSNVNLTTPVQLQGGTTYAIVATPSNGGTLAWYLSQNTTNPGGASQYSDVLDAWLSISGGPPPDLSLLYKVWAY